MNLFHHLQHALGLGESFDEYGNSYYDYGTAAIPPHPSAQSALDPESNVVGMPGVAPQGELIVMEPRGFEDVPPAITALRERKAVILNLNLMDPYQAQRSADYVAGGVFSLDGHQEQLAKNIFLFTPNSVPISSYPAPAASIIPPTGALMQPPTATAGAAGRRRSLLEELAINPPPRPSSTGPTELNLF